jgi:hypothetical protein
LRKRRFKIMRQNKTCFALIFRWQDESIKSPFAKGGLRGICLRLPERLGEEVTVSAKLKKRIDDAERFFDGLAVGHVFTVED